MIDYCHGVCVLVLCTYVLVRVVVRTCTCCLVDVLVKRKVVTRYICTHQRWLCLVLCLTIDWDMPWLALSVWNSPFFPTAVVTNWSFLSLVRCSPFDLAGLTDCYSNLLLYRAECTVSSRISCSSIGLAKAALESINGENLFGGQGASWSVIYVDIDAHNRNRTIFDTILPRESNSKVELLWSLGSRSEGWRAGEKHCRAAV